MINTPPIAILLGNGSTVLTHAALRHAVDEMRTDDGQELEAYHVQKSQPGEGVHSDARDFRNAYRSPVMGRHAERYEAVAARVAATRGLVDRNGRNSAASTIPSGSLPVGPPVKTGLSQRVRPDKPAVARYRQSSRYGAGYAPEQSGPEWHA